ncbi:GNAT family N-acetyltransferase [Candidatus Bathyarchaeota archaeon]|nr:MAG: GNAT family N-acetyltransferase [Candidatus Bathyarchaeota archaeon]
MIRPKRPESNRVKIRKATAVDKAPILEICKNIWNGHDYLPGVWDDWLADKDGRLIVATVKGRTVGVAHASLQTPDVAWLEGVRVHEQYRGLGIAGKLNRALVEWARKRRARVARLCTGSSNIASKKHLAKIEFPLLQTFHRLDATRGLHAKPANVTRPRRSTKALWEWLSARPEFADNRAMYSDGWTWHPLTAQAFRKHAAHGCVLLTLRSKQTRACCILLAEDEVLTVGFVAGEPSEVGRLMRMSRFLMLQKRRRKLRVLLPAKSPLIRALQRSSFEKTGKILVYEKFLEE